MKKKKSSEKKLDFFSADFFAYENDATNMMRVCNLTLHITVAQESARSLAGRYFVFDSSEFDDVEVRHKRNCAEVQSATIEFHVRKKLDSQEPVFKNGFRKNGS